MNTVRKKGHNDYDQPLTMAEYNLIQMLRHGSKLEVKKYLQKRLGEQDLNSSEKI